MVVILFRSRLRADAGPDYAPLAEAISYAKSCSNATRSRPGDPPGGGVQEAISGAAGADRDAAAFFLRAGLRATGGASAFSSRLSSATRSF